MTPLASLPVLTAAEMRAAEDAAIAAGASIEILMERAGAGVAEQVRRLASGANVLVLCGPGNNGGDGYVAARVLREAGVSVRVAALGEPKSAAAAAARAAWGDPIEPFPVALPDEADHAPVVVDAMFGTGLSRPLENEHIEALSALVGHARVAIAIDLPSGVSTDTGEELNRSTIPDFDLTLALGGLKPAHVLQPAAARCGAVRIVDIGLDLDDVPAPRERISAVETLAVPRIAAPGPSSHKYNRGMVAVVAGAMHGAAELAARSAYGAGAGYVLLLTGGLPQAPQAIVRRPWRDDALADRRIGAVVIGPGLGRDDRARTKLATVLGSDRPLVIDGDALHLLDPVALQDRSTPTILTPHAGEFDALFGTGDGSKIVRAQRAAARANAIVVFKGADTVVARPDGRANVALPASAWLSVAGTGDVLAGTIAAMLAQRSDDPFAAACDGVWLHGEAARRAGAAFLADDLAALLPAALARCL